MGGECMVETIMSGLKVATMGKHRGSQGGGGSHIQATTAGSNVEVVTMSTAENDSDELAGVTDDEWNLWHWCPMA
ncbi:Os02g0588850 [Oryza sativa Japonica Group]|uniref:Os02g0588850 protein n=1 Tax=Oryza sativa subsp. japonica TaxID=39947 RepID=A0A0P0VL82_ORYSJ|nr:Os02g0588850 [Oryza sativa Japonica Group]